MGTAQQSDGGMVFPQVDDSGNIKVSMGTALSSATDSVTIAYPTPTTLLCTGAVAYTASQTGATVLDPTSGKKFVLVSYCISASAAGTIQLLDSAVSISPIWSFAANGGVVKSVVEGDARLAHYTSAVADNILKYTSGAGAAGSICVWYYEV